VLGFKNSCSIEKQLHHSMYFKTAIEFL